MDATALLHRWDGLGSREQRALVVGAIVIAAALAYAFVWQPLVTDLPRAERDAERAQARWERARAFDAVAGTRASVPSREPLDVAIRGALAKSGVAPADATLELSGTRGALTLPSIRFGTLVALIDTLARERAVHIVDASIIARVEPGRVRAELSLAR